MYNNERLSQQIQAADRSIQVFVRQPVLILWHSWLREIIHVAQVRNAAGPGRKRCSISVPEALDEVVEGEEQYRGWYDEDGERHVEVFLTYNSDTDME